MSVATWVRDDEIEADAILRELHLRAEITRVRAALRELVALAEQSTLDGGVETIRMLDAIAKAKEVLGNG